MNINFCDVQAKKTKGAVLQAKINPPANQSKAFKKLWKEKKKKW